LRIQARSKTAILVGIILWTIVGPNLALLGVVSSQGHSWTFFQAYSWLSGPRSLVETLLAEVTATYWLGTVTSMIGFFVFFVGALAMFKGEKTWVFWTGLIILGLTSVILFSTLWYVLAFGGYWPNYWRTLVPPIVGAVVFILIGLYMMKSGTKREEQGKIQLLNQ